MFSWPVASVVSHFGQMVSRSVSSFFGVRPDPMGSGEYKAHGAIDIPVDPGTTVMSIGSGVVDAVVPNHATAGTYVQINHENGYYSRYLHLSGVDVRPGQRVTMGQRIGLSGGAPGAYGSGRSTGPHVHLDVWWGKPFAGGYAVDPLPLLTREVARKAAPWVGILAAAMLSVGLVWRFREPLRKRIAQIRA
jgi:murein DD-endopeptidase MepM/ murein hydrolase activator NlpD